MSLRRGTGPTRVHEALAANHTELIVPGIIIKAKDGTANVAITAETDRVMVWLSAGTDKEAIGLVCEQGRAPYICLWDEEPDGFPPLAITADGVQLRGAPGTEAVRQYPLAALIKAIDEAAGPPVIAVGTPVVVRHGTGTFAGQVTHVRGGDTLAADVVTWSALEGWTETLDVPYAVGRQVIGGVGPYFLLVGEPSDTETDDAPSGEGIPPV